VIASQLVNNYTQQGRQRGKLLCRNSSSKFTEHVWWPLVIFTAPLVFKLSTKSRLIQFTPIAPCPCTFVCPVYTVLLFALIFVRSRPAYLTNTAILANHAWDVAVTHHLRISAPNLTLLFSENCRKVNVMAQLLTQASCGMQPRWWRNSRNANVLWRWWCCCCWWCWFNRTR